jgi:hypothetical protein
METVMFVEFDPEHETYSIHEGGLIRSRLTAAAARQLMDAPKENCDAIMAAARRAASADGDRNA